MPYTELEHTADVLIRVWGKTIEELFVEAGLAMVRIMFGGGSDQGIIHSFYLEADDRESLLHDFLSEILYISDAEGIVFSDISVEITETHLFAVLKGELFDPDRHRGGTEIKGISFSGLHIIKEEERYQVDILFDV